MDRHESVGKLISIIYRQIQIYLNKELVEYGLSSGQIQVFSVLLKNEEINQDTISKILYLDKANIARAVNKLVKLGYVKRRIDPNDRRAYILSLTQKGKKIRPAIRKILKELTNTLLKGFDESERSIPLIHLNKMYQNILDSKEK